MHANPKPKYRIQDILLDNKNWERYKLLHSGELKDYQIKAVESMLLCGDLANGFFEYKCDHCGETYIVARSCNSRFCPRCGAKHVNAWKEKISSSLLNVNHNHLIFTLPDELWEVLKDNWKCIAELSIATQKVMKESMTAVAKQQITPGTISAIQTFGEAINYNVHFHNIVTEGGNTKNNNWKSISYIPYGIIRRKWKYNSLEIITKHVELTSRIQRLLAALKYERYPNGFNIRLVKSKIPKKELVGYIARYIRHPPISNRRIIGYNDETVTILIGKNQGLKIYKQFTVEEFIRRLVQHISPPNFKMVRHLGLYARNKKKHLNIKQATILGFGIPKKQKIPCPNCGNDLRLVSYFPETPPPNKKLGELITDWIAD